MGTTVTLYTAAASDAQDYASSISNDLPITVGSISNTSYAVAYRHKPDISQVGERVVVDSFTTTVTASSSNGGGAFNGTIGIHNGNCPILSTNNIATGYTDIGNSATIVFPSSKSAGDTLTSPSLKAAAQAWFNRSAYAQADYLGIWLNETDAAKNEYWDLRDGDYATSTERPCIDLTYHKASKSKWNGTSNVNLKLNKTGSDNLIQLV
jgi:hypothetical protein